MTARMRNSAKVIPMTAPPAVPGAVLGRVVGVEGATLQVEVAGRGVLRARVAMPLTTTQAQAAVVAGAEAVLVFAEGDPERALVMGLVLQALEEPAEPEEKPAVARIDGQRVVLEGKEEVVLKCGEATLTLRANGKVVIRGAYVETRARGTNRIKGGSVQIN